MFVHFVYCVVSYHLTAFLDSAAIAAGRSAVSASHRCRCMRYLKPFQETLPGSVNATQTARGGSAPVNGPLRLSEVPDSRVTKPFGNILCE